MAHIGIHLIGPATKCVTLTTKHFATAVTQDHALSI